MNAKGIISSLIIWMLLSVSTETFAQKASAEFISSMDPMTLTTGEQVRDGVQHVFYKDQRLYVTNVWAGLQILDVSTMEAPVELGSYRTEERSHNVYVQDNYAYLSNELGGVIVLDVTNPGNIVKISQIETEEDAYWVVADYPNIFVAEAGKGVNVYNIDDPANPRRIGGYQTPQWAWGLYLEETTLYVADKTGGLILLDVTNPANPTRLGQYAQMNYTKNVYVENDVAYVANGPSGLSMIDVSNPKFPKLISKLEIDGFVYHAQRSGNSVYLANELRRRLEIVDVTDLSNPVKVAEYVTEGKVFCASKFDVYVFLAADNKTVILRHNNPPVIVNIEDQQVDETQNLSIVAQGSDPDDDPIFYMIENLPQGAAFDSLSGSLTWTPTYEQSGNYPNIAIKVAERTATQLSASTEFMITVNHVNRNPELPDVGDSTIAENQTITFVIPEGSDPDVEDKGRLVYLAENLPEGASFDQAARRFTWTPTYEQSGVYMVDFVVQDPTGAVMRDGSSITVTHVDRKPSIEPITAQVVNENEELTFTIVGTDPDQEDQNLLSYSAKNLPEGAGFDATSATFSWTPGFDQSGEYPEPVFIFTAGNLSDSLNVPITVTHVNRPPVLADILNQSVDENAVLNFSIAGSDPDTEDSGKLTYTAENLPSGATFNADSLIFTWMPDFEQSGTYEEIRFIVNDPDGLSDAKAISINVGHVNRTPDLAAIEPKSVNENEQLVFSLLGTDPDQEDEGKLVYTVEGLPDGAVFEGTDFAWTPTFDQSGVYELSFTVSDGRLQDTETTTITVNHINREPAIVEIPPQSTAENQVLSFEVVGSDPDTEDDGLWRLSAQSVPEGAVFEPQQGNFNWTPGFDQSGEYTVTFFNTDSAGLQSRQDVVITVEHVNRTPVFPEQPAQTVNEDSLLSYNLIPAEDPDVEDEGQLQYSAENLPDGAEFDADNLTLNWKPDFDQSGTYTIDFTISDTEFSVSQSLDVTVNHVNRPPVLETVENQSIEENQTWSLSVTYSDPDAEDEGNLTLSASNLPQGAVFDAARGTFDWTPTYEQSGSYPAVMVTVTDSEGLTDEAGFDIQVNHVNRAPSLQPIAEVTGTENNPLEIQLEATDPDDEDQGKLLYTALELPEGATLDEQTGLFSWTPNFLQANSYTVTFTVTDTEGATAEQEASLVIADLNRIPVIDPVPAQAVDENSPLSFTITASDEDTDNTLTYSAENLPEGAAFDAENQTFSWTPGFEQAGSYTVTFNVTDGKESASASTDITVENVNRPPRFEESGPQSVNENDNLTFTINATDDDAGTELSYSASDLPEGASFDAASRTFSWTPGYEDAGEYAVQFSVSDGEETVTNTTNITVINVNRLPVFDPVDAKSVAETEGLSFSVNASDEDQGTTLDYTANNLPSGASFTDQTFSWTPDYDQEGEYTVNFIASDGEGQVELPVQISVANVNREPSVSGPGEQDVRAGETLNLNYNGNDPDNDPLEYSSPNLPSGADLDANNGTLRWTPSDDQVGRVTFTIRVSDGESEAETETTVNVRRSQPQTTPATQDTSDTNP